MFKNLKNEVNNYYDNLIVNDIKDLENEESYTLKEYLTTLKYNQYLKASSINDIQQLEKLKSFAIKKITKKWQTRKTEILNNIEAIESAPDFENGCIYVNWTRSRTWGYNPTAEFVSTTNATTYGHASGWGYDKLSAATSSALNDNKSILKALYIKEEERLNYNKPRRDFLGYGSGYGCLPYFEGGVGQSSINDILKNLGFTVQWHETNNNDTIVIYK